MESILNAAPRQAVPPQEQHDTGLRPSVILVIIGLAACALGAMMYGVAAASGGGNGNESSVSGIGYLLFGFGVLLFLLGILVEFFAIGTALRSIARSSAAAASLLRGEHRDRVV